MRMVNFFLGLILLLVIAALAAVFLLQGKKSWSVGEVARTPDARFENLPDYDFEPHYAEVLGYRIHYVDEGPRRGPVVLLMHGQPSWSYLYRHMIPRLTLAGYRVIAPDLVGFGKSDKPLKQSDYSYQMHLDVMTAFVEDLGIKDVTLFAQDWGGLLGLRMVPEAPDTYARVMISNTALPAAKGIMGWIAYPLFRFGVWREGTVETMGIDGGEFSFTKWVAYSKTTSNFDIETLFQTATHRTLSDAELAGYAAPFVDETHLAGARAFPFLVPSQLRENQRAMTEFWAKWDKPFMTAFSDKDPVSAGGEKIWQRTVPGAKSQLHVIVKDGAHFVQDDQPEELVRLLVSFIEHG